MRIIIVVVILALLSLNGYIFWENQKLKGEIEKTSLGKKEKESLIEKSQKNSRLLGLFFDGILSDDEEKAEEFTTAVQSSADEETIARYQEVVKSSSPESLLGLGKHLNETNIELLSE